MNNRIIISSIALAVLLLYGCLQSQEVNKAENVAFDQTTNWTILNKTDGEKKGNTYSWNFTVKNPADYVVQVVFNKLGWEAS